MWELNDREMTGPQVFLFTIWNSRAISDMILSLWWFPVLKQLNATFHLSGVKSLISHRMTTQMSFSAFAGLMFWYQVSFFIFTRLGLFENQLYFYPDGIHWKVGNRQFVQFVNNMSFSLDYSKGKQLNHFMGCDKAWSPINSMSWFSLNSFWNVPFILHRRLTVNWTKGG